MKKELFWLIAAIPPVSSAFANCYVIKNNSPSPIELRFHYSKDIKEEYTPIGKGRYHSWIVFPGKSFKGWKGDAWCLNIDNLSVSIEVIGASHTSWSGTLIAGNGAAFFPSGTYTINP